MGKRGPKTQSQETRRQIGESLRSSAAFQKSMQKRTGQHRAPDTIETRARKSAIKYAPPGTDRYRFEYELALQRISLMENQAKRRELFISQTRTETDS
jgi:hypothetical protein